MTTKPPPGLTEEEWEHIASDLRRVLRVGRGEVRFVIRSKRIVKSEVTTETEWQRRGQQPPEVAP